MPFNPVVYNPGANILQGAGIAAQSLNDAGSNIGSMLQKLGMMHLQDQASGAVLNGMKENGMLDDKVGGALYKAATMPGAPTGAKSMVLDLMRTQLAQNFELKKAQAGFLMQKNGIVAPQQSPAGNTLPASQPQAQKALAQPPNQGPELTGQGPASTVAQPATQQGPTLSSLNPTNLNAPKGASGRARDPQGNIWWIDANGQPLSQVK